MKNQYILATLVFAVLLIGVFVLRPEESEQKSHENEVEDRKDPDRSEKARRLAERDSSEAGALPVHAREGRRLPLVFLKSGGGGLFGRTFVPPAPGDELPSHSLVDGQAGEVQSSRRGTENSPDSRSSRPGAREIAGDAVAHRRGHLEFMRRRLEELAAHAPTCKCAYHTGKH